MATSRWPIGPARRPTTTRRTSGSRSRAQELDPETKGDVLELKVVMDMDNMTSFDLTINNWDDRTIGFKYSDSDTFDVGNRVHVLMGYADRLRSMVTGQIATLTPRFPRAGRRRSPSAGSTGCSSCATASRPTASRPGT